jgi:predicted metal-dependent hydrolase
MTVSRPSSLPYLNAYSSSLQDQVRDLLQQKALGQWLLNKYKNSHAINSDKALFEYVQELKNEYMRNAPPLSKVAYSSQLKIIQHALGTHTTISRVQGNQLKAKREIKVASLFKQTPLEFLKMIVVHELAHIKVKDHDKSFYQLCTHMEPLYHQFELDLRLYLTYQDHAEGPEKNLWFNTI